MWSVELYLMHNVQWMMHNCDVHAHLLPRKLALPSLGGAGRGSPLWAGGRFLSISFTNAFAGRAVLKNKRGAVENTRVLSTFVRSCQSVGYGYLWKKRHEMIAISGVICVTLLCDLMQNTL